MRVLKIGGNQLDDPAFIAGAAQIVAKMPELPVIVHGGGKGIKALQERLGIVPQYVDGLRVTDAATLEIVMMVLCGQANLNIVSALVQAGIEAQGLNGADRGLLRARPGLRPNGSLRRVGEVSAVRSDIIREMLAAKVVPVIAPVLLGDDGGFFNANADKAAGAIAAALGAKQVIFLTDVAGVQYDGARLDHVTQAQIQGLIRDNIITGGMVVKVNAALDALSAGVKEAMITNLDGLSRGMGTIVTA